MSKGGNLPRSGPVVQENYGGMPTPMPQIPMPPPSQMPLRRNPPFNPKGGMPPIDKEGMPPIDIGGPMPQLPPPNRGPVPLYNDPQPVGPTTGATGGSPVPLYNQEPVNVDTLPSEIFNEIAVPLPVLDMPPNTPILVPPSRPPVRPPYFRNPPRDGGFLPMPSPPFMRPPRQRPPSLPFARDMARFRYAPQMRREEQSLFPNQSGIASLMGQSYGRSMSRPNYQPMRQPPMRRPIMPRPPSRGKGGGYRPMPRPPSRGKGGGFPPIRTMR